MKRINFNILCGLALACVLVLPAVAREDESWIDAPQTPGDWEYIDEPRESLALFGNAADRQLVVLRCDKIARQVGIARKGSADRSLMMRVRTEVTDRILAASQIEGRGLVGTSIAASDPLLDAMALSRGRFSIEIEGLDPLYLPAWAEVTRVIEDCR